MSIAVYSGSEAQAALRRLKGRLFDLLARAEAPDERARPIFGEALSPRQAVGRIIEGVRERGDDALREYSRVFDHRELPPVLKVPRADLESARDALDQALRRALEQAAENIRRYQERLLPLPREVLPRPGEPCGYRRVPLARVGVYVPGGSAPLVSSVLMSVIPAQVAGVGDIAVCSPPHADGRPEKAILGALGLLGVTEVYPLGGAQAVAALAFGTKSVPRVDKVVGPGNLYVALAKRACYGVVDIDMFAGPSEVVIVAADGADPDHVAADLLAQAEHDPLAAAIAITCDAALASRISDRVAARLCELPRAEVAQAALDAFGACLIARDLDEALDWANELAPEHLELLIANPECRVPRVPNAGAVFLGPWSPEPIGDYLAGPSHTLPTGGTARFFSGLSAAAFFKTQSLIAYDAGDFSRDHQAALTLARQEGLDAHARSVESRCPLPKAPPEAPVREATIPRTEASDLRARSLVRAAVRIMSAYTPGFQPRDADVCKLNTNENPWPPSPRVAEALAAFEVDRLRRYPPPRADALRRAIAARHGLRPDQVLVGNGSDEVLAMLVRATVEKNGAILTPTPTYSLYPVLAAAQEARLFEIPFTPDWQLPPAFLDRLPHVALSFLCNPNSPSGTLLPRPQIEEAARLAGGLLVIDEAYVDFADGDARSLLDRHRHVVIARTLSKSASLAGLRLGYALGDADLISQIDKVRDSYNVSALAQTLALAALEDAEYLRETIARVVRDRASLAAMLETRGFTLAPSRANFLWATPASGRDAAQIAASLAQRGVFVRYFNELPRAVRISVGTPAQHERLCRALDEIFAAAP